MLFDLLVAAVLQWPLQTAFWAVTGLAITLVVIWAWTKAFKEEVQWAADAAEAEAAIRHRINQRVLRGEL